MFCVHNFYFPLCFSDSQHERLEIRNRHGVSALQIRRDFGELGERSLEVFDNFLRDNVGIGEIGAIFERLVLQPENVEVELESPAVARASVTGRAIKCQILRFDPNSSTEDLTPAGPSPSSIPNR